MRGLAQIAFGLVFVLFIAAFKAPALLFGYWLLLPPLVMPVLYYYIFERHREGQTEQIAAHLERIADALTAAKSDERSEPVRRSVVGSALLR